MKLPLNPKYPSRKFKRRYDRDVNNCIQRERGIEKQEFLHTIWRATTAVRQGHITKEQFRRVLRHRFDTVARQGHMVDFYAGLNDNRHKY